MATSALTQAALLLPLLLLAAAAATADAKRGPMHSQRCSKLMHDIEEDAVVRIIRDLEVPDETSDDQKCLLRCVLTTLRLVRAGQLDTKQIMMSIRTDVQFANKMSSFYGQNISVDMDRLSSDVEACVTTEDNPDCDTVYNQFKCLSDLISNGNMASYATFVEADAAEAADWMRRRLLLVGRPRRRGGPHGGPPGGPHGGHRRGGRPPPPPPESESDENDVEELE